MKQQGSAARLRIGLRALEGREGRARRGAPAMEFHVLGSLREELGVDDALFSVSGNVLLADFRATRELAAKLNSGVDAVVHPERMVKAGQLNAMGLIDEILHYVAALYREANGRDLWARALAALEAELGAGRVDAALLEFTRRFPPVAVHRGALAAEAWLAGSEAGVPRRELALEEMMLLKLANLNPAFEPFARLFPESVLASSAYGEMMRGLEAFLGRQPKFGPDSQTLFDMLRSPAIHSPRSLPGQLEFIRTRWGLIIGKFLKRILSSADLIREEDKPRFLGPGPSRVADYSGLDFEYEGFSPDSDWMPRVVMVAKSTLVWLSQLSERHGRAISRLDQVPDEELDFLAESGFNTLWLIGLWERSRASRRIKEICGNPEAAASAYSLRENEIAGELGGWAALEELRRRCAWRGIRLAADMVPNHTAMDSRWVSEHPEYFMQSDYPPFPGYSFNGENLSDDPGVGIYLEDHYYSRSDAAVVFKRVDFGSGRARYIYHGNDGTSMPWNDTAQIDFLNHAAREAVIREIVRVAKAFPVIRFDAAMILAKRHFRRLWYPEPGQGGDIASRAERSMTTEEFNRAMPAEFWREVVDRCAKEAPDCLLLAEAFWMMEGYFVRTLGMHRVYNSAFMNMLKNEENAKYRSTIKNTQEFDREILKRFVNFMNNPDEETAAVQFGKGDKYFGICTMMVTMPGLPMFGHGQVEGLEEKYGMEYRKAYWKEGPDAAMVERHRREVFPLMKRRHVFSGSDNFLLYDFFSDSGAVNENVFAYSNQSGDSRALVLYNNSYERASGWIRISAAFAEKEGEGRKLVQRGLGDALGLGGEANRFCLLREQRSGLWFLRKSAELRAQGMYAMLSGYQCQVFLDIQEVEDDERGHFAMLHGSLNGAGVPDIQSAILDIVLKDLYGAWAELASVDRLGAFRRALVQAAEGAPAKRAGKARAEEDFAAGAGAAARDFYATAMNFLEDAGFAPIAGTASLADAAAAAFSASLAEATKLAKSLKGRASDLGTTLRARPEAPLVLYCYLALDALGVLAGREDSKADVAGIVEYWCLERKLRESLQEAGVPGDIAWRETGQAKGAYLSLDLPVRPYREEAEAMAADDAWKGYLGINTFDGVVWYNKEKFESFVAYRELFAAMWGRSPARPRPGRFLRRAALRRAPLAERVAAAEAEAGAWLDAESRSQFKLAPLLENLGDAGQAAAKPDTKAAKKEKDAAPGSAKKPPRKRDEE